MNRKKTQLDSQDYTSSDFIQNLLNKSTSSSSTLSIGKNTHSSNSIIDSLDQSSSPKSQNIIHTFKKQPFFKSNTQRQLKRPNNFQSQLSQSNRFALFFKTVLTKYENPVKVQQLWSLFQTLSFDPKTFQHSFYIIKEQKSLCSLQMNSNKKQELKVQSCHTEFTQDNSLSSSVHRIQKKSYKKRCNSMLQSEKINFFGAISQRLESSCSKLNKKKFKNTQNKLKKILQIHAKKIRMAINTNQKIIKQAFKNK